MIPYLPESAPFPPSQRAWLNGFFAGLLSGATPVGGAASMPGMGVPGLSAAGGAGFGGGPSESAVALAPPPAAEVETFPWHDPNLSMEERLQMAEGKPPARKLMAAMAQLDCGSCGYLCQTYAEAIAEGKEKNLKLCTPGGKETAVKLKQLVQIGAPAGNGAAKPASPAAAAPTANGHAATPSGPGYSAKSPVQAVFRKAVKLNREGGDKDVRQIVIDLAATGLSYEPGDSLGVLPHNCPVLVPRALELLGLAADSPVTIDGETLPAAQWLRTRKSITEMSSEALLVMAGAATSPEEAALLRAWADGGEGLPDGLDLVEALERFPSARPAAADLVAALDDLRPRLYSISSSLRAHPGEVHLTVGMVQYGLRDRLRKGVASNHLGLHCEEGCTVGVYIQKSHGFRLPTNPEVGAVMIGPGTGIAPFRAFLEERKAIQAKGPNWLFFGDQRSRTDFLYEEELTAYQKEGWLHRLDLAFSRDQAEKIYVQHRMQESAAELWKWLSAGAHLYVCGDAKRMAKDVDGTLLQIAREQGGLTDEAAKQWAADLAKAGRYQRDVY